MNNKSYRNKFDIAATPKSNTRQQDDAGMGSSVANIAAVAMDIGLLLFQTSPKRHVAFTAFKVARYGLRAYVLIKNAKSKSSTVSVQTKSTFTANHKH